VRRVHGEIWGVAAAFLFGGSSYAVFFSQVLTRNALTPLWAGLLIWLGVELVENETSALGSALRLVALTVVLTLALATYSSFKVAAAPFYFSLGVSLLLARRWRVFGGAVLSGLAVLALTGLWAHLSDTHLELLLYRGDYAMGHALTALRFSRHLWRTLLLPVMRDPVYNDFVIEETNTVFARAMLPAVAAPFFVIGLLRALWVGFRRPGELWGALMFLAAAPVFALGGPNLKHCFLLFPWVVLLTIGGVRTVYEWTAHRMGPLAPSLALLLASAVFLRTEGVQLLRTIPGDIGISDRNGLPLATAASIVRNRGDRKTVLAVNPLGLSILRLEMLKAARAEVRAPMEVVFVTDQVTPELTARLQESDALLVIQGDSEPRLLSASKGLRDCFQKKVDRVGAHATSLFFRKDSCTWTGAAPDPPSTPSAHGPGS
jgi:hypothetical protein